MSKQAAHLRDLSAREEQRRLSKEELLRPRIIEKEVPIDGLGGTIVIRSLSHAARQEIRAKAHWNTEEWDEDLFTCLGVVHSLVEPALTEEDLADLRQQDQSIFDEIVMQITLLNMLGRTEELKKDSSETQNSDSASS